MEAVFKAQISLDIYELVQDVLEGAAHQFLFHFFKSSNFFAKHLNLLQFRVCILIDFASTLRHATKNVVYALRRNFFSSRAKSKVLKYGLQVPTFNLDIIKLKLSHNSLLLPVSLLLLRTSLLDGRSLINRFELTEIAATCFQYLILVAPDIERSVRLAILLLLLLLLSLLVRSQALLA